MFVIRISVRIGKSVTTLPMHQLLNDNIDVLAEFKGKHIKPRLVRWDNRVYHVTSLNLVHSAREGRTKVYYFSVSDSANFMKLRLDTDSLEWRLVEIYTDG